MSTEARGEKNGKGLLNEIQTGCQAAILVGGFRVSRLHKRCKICYSVLTTVKINTVARMLCSRFQIQFKAILTGVECNTDIIKT